MSFSQFPKGFPTCPLQSLELRFVAVPRSFTHTPMNKRFPRCLLRAMPLRSAATDLDSTNGFTLDTSWPGELPPGWKYRMVSNMAADSQGRLYVADPVSDSASRPPRRFVR